jgi:hypothetical protein
MNFISDKIRSSSVFSRYKIYAFYVEYKNKRFRDSYLRTLKAYVSIIQALSGGHVIRAHQWVYQGNRNRLVRLERGNSETAFSVLHQAYALEQALYARDVIKWFMPCACIGIEL